MANLAVKWCATVHLADAWRNSYYIISCQGWACKTNYTDTQTSTADFLCESLSESFTWCTYNDTHAEWLNFSNELSYDMGQIHRRVIICLPLPVPKVYAPFANKSFHSRKNFTVHHRATLISPIRLIKTQAVNKNRVKTRWGVILLLAQCEHVHAWPLQGFCLHFWGICVVKDSMTT